MLPTLPTSIYNDISRHNPKSSINKNSISTAIYSLPEPRRTALLCDLIAIKYYRQGLWNNDEQLDEQNRLWNKIKQEATDETPSVADLMAFVKNDGYSGYVFQRKLPAEFQQLLSTLLDFEKQNIINSFDDAYREDLCNFLADATGKDWGDADVRSGLVRDTSAYYPKAHSSKKLLTKNEFFSLNDLDLLDKKSGADLFYLKGHADAGHPVAQNLLGELYGDVYGVSSRKKIVDVDEAVKYLMQSAEKGNDQAKHNLLNMFSDNRGLEGADIKIRSHAVTILKEGAQKYGNSILGNNCRKVLSGQLRLEIGDAEAIKFLDEMMEMQPNINTLKCIADLLCASDVAQRSLGTSKVEDYLKQAAHEPKLKHSRAALAYADICSNSEYSFFRDVSWTGFGSPEETAGNYRKIAQDNSTEFGGAWSDLSSTSKATLISAIFSSERMSGNVDIPLANGNTVNARFKLKGEGTTSLVYAIRIGKTAFSVKILRNGINAGESAKELTNHSIEGLVPLLGTEVISIEQDLFSIVIMGSMKSTWTEWFDKNNATYANLLEHLGHIKRLAQCLVILKEQGFNHGNVGQPNIMFDSSGQVFFVDIDQLPRVSDKYSQSRETNDCENLNRLLYSIISLAKLREKDKKSLMTSWETAPESPTVEKYLQTIITIIDNAKQIKEEI